MATTSTIVDSRPRGVLSGFGLSHIRFRQTTHAGELPGVTEAGW